MNEVLLTGRLTKDPEARGSVVNFAIAVDRHDKNNSTDFPRITVFGKQGENCMKYLKKGSIVGINGRLQTGSYEKDGITIYTTDVIADRVEFLSKPLDF